MPLSLAQAQVLIAAAHDHAVANDWKIAVAVVDEGGLLVALGRMDGAFPLSAQIAEAKAVGTALWQRDGEQLAASRAAHEGFFDAVSRLVRLPLIPGPGAIVIRSGEGVLGAAGASGASGDDDRACVEAGLRAVFPGHQPLATKRAIASTACAREPPCLRTSERHVSKSRAVPDHRSALAAWTAL